MGDESIVEDAKRLMTKQMENLLVVTNCARISLQ